MKKNNFIKLFSLTLCLLMLFSTFALVAGAKEEEYEPIEWRLDKNLEYLIGDNKRYERYYANGAFYGDADSIFIFKNGAYYENTYCEVYGDSAYPHIVSVRTGNGYSSIFVDEEGKKILDAFLDGSDCIYYLEDYGISYTVLEKELVKYLDSAYNKGTGLKSVDVSVLGQSKIYEITAHDATETKAYQHGAIYVFPDGKHYYVCFDDLPNNYFDADGYFSYRSGSVMAFEITDRSRLKSIDTAISDMVPRKHQTIYEGDVLNGFCDVYGNPVYNFNDYVEPLGVNRTAAIISFFVMSFIVGIAIPAVLLIFGIVFARAKRLSKCFYAVSACAALWIVSAALFLLLVLI